jgi:hypothetical protein
LAQYDIRMRLILLSLAVIAVFVNPVHAQDERFWRKLISGQLTRDQEKEVPEAKWLFGGPSYQFDLDGDGRNETIQVLKRDGIDWLDIRSFDKSLLFSDKLAPTGVEARVHRLRVVDLSQKARAIIVYYYEGKTETKKFEAVGRLYFISIENRDLKTMKMVQGPRYWHEYEAHRDQYWRRLHSVNVKDTNGDGEKEIFVNFNHIQSIWKFRGNGRWTEF